MLKERSHMHLTTDKFIGMTSDASKHKQLMHTSRIHNICNVFFFENIMLGQKFAKLYYNKCNKLSATMLPSLISNQVCDKRTSIQGDHQTTTVHC